MGQRTDKCHFGGSLASDRKTLDTLGSDPKGRNGVHPLAIHFWGDLFGTVKSCCDSTCVCCCLVLAVPACPPVKEVQG